MMRYYTFALMEKGHGQSIKDLKADEGHPQDNTDCLIYKHISLHITYKP